MLAGMIDIAKNPTRYSLWGGDESPNSHQENESQDSDDDDDESNDNNDEPESDDVTSDSDCDDEPHKAQVDDDDRNDTETEDSNRGYAGLMSSSSDFDHVSRFDRNTNDTESQHLNGKHGILLGDSSDLNPEQRVNNSLVFAVDQYKTESKYLTHLMACAVKSICKSLVYKHQGYEQEYVNLLVNHMELHPKNYVNKTILLVTMDNVDKKKLEVKLSVVNADTGYEANVSLKSTKVNDEYKLFLNKNFQVYEVDYTKAWGLATEKVMATMDEEELSYDDLRHYPFVNQIDTMIKTAFKSVQETNDHIFQYQSKVVELMKTNQNRNQDQVNQTSNNNNNSSKPQVSQQFQARPQAYGTSNTNLLNVQRQYSNENHGILLGDSSDFNPEPRVNNSLVFAVWNAQRQYSNENHGILLGDSSDFNHDRNDANNAASEDSHLDVPYVLNSSSDELKNDAKPKENVTSGGDSSDSGDESQNSQVDDESRFSNDRNDTQNTDSNGTHGVLLGSSSVFNHENHSEAQQDVTSVIKSSDELKIELVYSDDSDDANNTESADSPVCNRNDKHGKPKDVFNESLILSKIPKYDEREMLLRERSKILKIKYTKWPHLNGMKLFDLRYKLHRLTTKLTDVEIVDPGNKILDDDEEDVHPYYIERLELYDELKAHLINFYGASRLPIEIPTSVTNDQIRARINNFNTVKSEISQFDAASGNDDAGNGSNVSDKSLIWLNSGGNSELHEREMLLRERSQILKIQYTRWEDLDRMPLDDLRDKLDELRRKLTNVEIVHPGYDPQDLADEVILSDAYSPHPYFVEKYELLNEFKRLVQKFYGQKRICFVIKSSVTNDELRSRINNFNTGKSKKTPFDIPSGAVVIGVGFDNLDDSDTSNVSDISEKDNSQCNIVSNHVETKGLPSIAADSTDDEDETDVSGVVSTGDDEDIMATYISGNDPGLVLMIMSMPSFDMTSAASAAIMIIILIMHNVLHYQ